MLTRSELLWSCVPTTLRSLKRNVRQIRRHLNVANLQVRIFRSSSYGFGDRIVECMSIFVNTVEIEFTSSRFRGSVMVSNLFTYGSSRYLVVPLGRSKFNSALGTNEWFEEHSLLWSCNQQSNEFQMCVLAVVANWSTSYWRKLGRQWCATWL